MTLVAALYTDDGPLILGDLMASARVARGTDTHLILPSGYLPLEKIKGPYRPVAAVQKVVIINDECVLCWSGAMDYVPRLISDLRRELVFEGTSQASINNWRMRNGLEVINHQALMVVWHEALNQFGFWANPLCESLGNVEGLGTLFTAGSGSNHLKDALKRTWPLKEVKRVPHGSKSVASGLTLATELFNMEAFHNVSQPELYGMGYEICSWQGERFVKLDDFLLAHTIVHVTDDHADLAAPLSAVRLYYQNDVACLTAIPQKPDGGRVLLGMIARPPDKLDAPGPAPAVSLNARHYGISVNAVAGDRVLLHTTKHIELMADAGDRPITFDIDKDWKGFAMRYNPTFAESMFNWAITAPRKFLNKMRVNVELGPPSGRPV